MSDIPASIFPEHLRSKLRNPAVFQEIITGSKSIFNLFLYVETIANTTQPVLITGETGVGKELFARAIHMASGKKGSFVSVNVSGLDDTLFSDTLFGHGKGAYTGADHVRRGLVEKAKGGTIFLDEIGDLNHSSQVKLLRLVQSGEYFSLGKDEPLYTDARIVTATNQDLWSLQKQDKFRKDLNFRLRTHHIHIPPLREREDDIPILINHFIEKAGKTLGMTVPGLRADLAMLFRGYHFPGNIRELEGLLFDLVSRSSGQTLQVDFIKEYIKTRKNADLVQSSEINLENTTLLFPEKFPTIKETVRLLIEEAVRRSKGNLSRAAVMLGISRQALSKRMSSQ